MAKNSYNEILTGDGQTVAQSFRGSVWVHLSDDFGGGTATVRVRDAAGVMRAVAGAAFVVAADALLDFPEGATNVIDVDLASSTTPNLVVNLEGEDR